jgi:hypothetical protein
MTMEEIDRLRAELDKKRAEVRRWRDAVNAGPIDPSIAQAALSAAEFMATAGEAAVEAALREWWAQGCKEVEK